MLASIDKEGHIHWYCPGKKCPHHPGTAEPTDPTMIHLPLCECGAQLSLNVAFTEEELDEDRPDLGQGKRTSHHSAVPRHQELARQLAAIGKL